MGQLTKYSPEVQEKQAVQWRWEWIWIIIKSFSVCSGHQCSLPCQPLATRCHCSLGWFSSQSLLWHLIILLYLSHIQVIAYKSDERIFHSQPILYVLLFGLVFAKITNRLVASFKISRRFSFSSIIIFSGCSHVQGRNQSQGCDHVGPSGSFSQSVLQHLHQWGPSSIPCPGLGHPGPHLVLCKGNL